MYVCIPDGVIIEIMDHSDEGEEDDKEKGIIVLFLLYDIVD